ncbi:MAG TPA: hypothetical protein VMT18_08800 [Planctomycetota bacterium]|nr:hypothetical protein [Planctomycetota bacterium]
MASPAEFSTTSFHHVHAPLGDEPPRPTSTAQLDDTQLLSWIRDAVAIVDRCLDARERGATAEHVALSGARRSRLLELLGEWLESEDPCLVPTPDPNAPLAHACPRVEEPLGLQPGAGLEVLEHLAELGLLSRELHNLVHLCGVCRSWKLNFREVCPACRDIDLRSEPMLQHFACAYVGLDSEFRRGLELVCPRCELPMHQLGHDYERPHTSWVCNACDDLFEEPLVEVQCLACEAVHEAGELEPVPVHRYLPTATAVRAVETGRLTGIELQELLCDRRAGLDSRDFLRVEVTREVARLARHGGVFSVAVLEFLAQDGACPVFERWSHEELRALSHMLGGLRSPLDLVARLDAGRVGLLFPGSDERAARAIGERLLVQLDECDLVVADGRRRLQVRPRWRQRSWNERTCSATEVLDFLGLRHDEP